MKLPALFPAQGRRNTTEVCSYRDIEALLADIRRRGGKSNGLIVHHKSGQYEVEIFWPDAASVIPMNAINDPANQDFMTTPENPIGYRVQTFGDLVATHARCRHGVVVAAGADDHACSWTMLLANAQAEARQPARPTT